MSEQTAPEPTMEEILASIRRIISEDDAPAADAEETAPAATEPAAAEPAPEPVEAKAPEPEPAPEPVVEAEPEEDVLELTERVEPAAETHGDLDVYTKPEPEPEPAPVAAAPEPVAHTLETPEPERLVGEPAAIEAASSFGRLTAAVSIPADGQTLEAVVRELLKPLLKVWLDEHLPAIVEAKVAEEVERIARSRVR